MALKYDTWRDECKKGLTLHRTKHWDRSVVSSFSKFAWCSWIKWRFKN